MIVLECFVILVGFLMMFLKLMSCRIFLNFLLFLELFNIFELKFLVMMIFFLFVEIFLRIGRNLL